MAYILSHDASALVMYHDTVLNGIILRALLSAGFNAVLCPVYLDRGDGKRATMV